MIGGKKQLFIRFIPTVLWIQMETELGIWEELHFAFGTDDFSDSVRHQ